MDLVGVSEMAPDPVREGRAGVLELFRIVKGKGRVVLAARLEQQVVQGGRSRVAERLCPDQPQPLRGFDPFLHPLEREEPLLLLAEVREIPAPDGSGVLTGGPGVDEDLAVFPEGAASLGKERWKIEVVLGKNLTAIYFISIVTNC